ncbi:hypothetical protein [Atopomonas sediminilitoris]|uniref:hypothetical protein n=1 Tax=Atopomonas sediminilitoris TaxID=2919919 RepID=UPI001F4EA8B5|nr:hypothetical protein [Atopomonas sediminilitoris]MCJ8170537.1 hypothetical protein [Atopomonas sediminilitoris]
MQRRHLLQLFAASPVLATVAPSALAAAAAPTFTSWLPLQGQTHAIGRLSRSISPEWIKTWTHDRATPAGSFLRTQAVALPQGHYGVIFQVWHDSKPGQLLGELRAWQGGTLLARQPLVSETIADKHSGGYQRALLEVTLHGAAHGVEFELYFAAQADLWSGMVSVTPLDAPRPFYNIAHRCSTQAKVRDAVAAGANAIECDLTPKSLGDSVGFYVYHIGDVAYTHYRDFDAYLQQLKGLLDSGALAMVMLDCKQDKAIAPAHYARTLAERLLAVGIAPRQVVMSVPGNTAGEFRTALAELYPCAFDSYLEDYGDLTPAAWVQQVEATGATFVGVGAVVYDILKPMPHWMPWLQALTSRRDAVGQLRKSFFWTVDRAQSMSSALDAGVDAIITNKPACLAEVLAQAPYNRVLRLATGQDDLFARHGF